MLLMDQNVLAYGINTELKMIMDFAELALKIRNKMSKEFQKTLFLIDYLTAKEFANKKA